MARSTNNMISLKNFSVYANVPVVDVERARVFYRETLGLEELPKDSQMPGALFRAANNTRLYLYQREQTKADHTIMSFHVKDIEGVVSGLQKQGVVFETVQIGDIRTVDGVATIEDEKAAWFKDTEGNILGLYEKAAPDKRKEAGT